MKQGTLDRPTFETIEAYVLERMPAEERARFERRLAEDTDLREEVELERENIQAVELGGLTRMLKGIAQEERTEEGASTRWSAILKYAAVVAAIVTGAIWWMMRPSLNEKLFADHFTPDPGLPVAMGGTNDPAFADAMVAYKLGEFAEARTKWSTLLAREPANDTLLYYIANAWLAQGEPEKAIPMFASVVGTPSSVFHDRSRWFLYLAYVRNGELAKARALDLATDPTYGERVRAIEEALGD